MLGTVRHWGCTSEKNQERSLLSRGSGSHELMITQINAEVWWAHGAEWEFSLGEKGIWKKGKRALGCCGVVQRWGWGGKEKNNYFCSILLRLEWKSGQTVHSSPVLPLDFELRSKSTRLPSQISRKTPLRGVLRANLLNILAEGKWEDKWNLITPFGLETPGPCSAMRTREEN